MKRAICAAACVVSLVVTGCRNRQAVSPEPVGPAPAYRDVAAGYNSRLKPLARLWARTVVRIRFIDGEGKKQQEQVEGHCQYVRESKVLLSFHKAGQPLAMLGCNQERYWWMELGGDKKAFVGTHAAATPERIASAGLRVHPLDFISLIGLSPIPGECDSCTVRWSPDGKQLMLTVPGRTVARRLLLDPVTYRPQRIELVDGASVKAFAELSKYAAVSLRSAGPEVERPWVPTFITVEVDGGETGVIMELSEPQNDPSRFKPIAFDVEKQIEAYDVQDVRNLDTIEVSPRAR